MEVTIQEGVQGDVVPLPERAGGLVSSLIPLSPLRAAGASRKVPSSYK
jgi:hypothetical protein